MVPVNPEKFVSPAVDETVRAVSERIADPRLRDLFGRCLTNTLDTTVVFRDHPSEPDTFVITGDIPAMWLRDSAAQVWPYLRFVRDDARLARLVRGVVARHARMVLLDPYANAFTFDETGTTEHAGDLTEMRPGVFERKFEVDSLAYVIRLAAGYHAATHDRTIFTPDWLMAMHTIVDTLTVEQDHPSRSSYCFERPNAPEISTLEYGVGTPVARTGMPWSGFRPSDDRCEFHFLVPSAAFTVVMLQKLAHLVVQAGDTDLAHRAAHLAAQIQGGIHAHARVTHPVHGEILAYEVDGLGNAVLMDDANVPSLLSLPYLGWCEADNPLYVSTRRFVLGRANPHFAVGSLGEGVGSPHTPDGRVWPLSVIMRVLTSRDEREMVACLRMLRDLAGPEGLMHESVNPDDPAEFSRAWFAWANTLFGEMILHLAEAHPAVLAAEL